MTLFPLLFRWAGTEASSIIILPTYENKKPEVLWPEADLIGPLSAALRYSSMWIAIFSTGISQDTIGQKKVISHWQSTEIHEMKTERRTRLSPCTIWTTEVRFLVPDWGDKVDSGIGLSYRPAKLNRLAARYDTLCRSQLYPHSGTMNLATGADGQKLSYAEGEAEPFAHYYF